MYKTEIMVHESGERLPMLVDEQGFPIIVPNEFALTRRGDAWRTIEKKLNHIALLHQWAKNQSIDLNEAVSKCTFTEAQINGSLLDFLRRSRKQGKVQKIAVEAKTFNTRLIHLRQYLSWRFANVLTAMASTDLRFEPLQQKQQIIIEWLYEAHIATSVAENEVSKSLSQEQRNKLLEIIELTNTLNPWKNKGIRSRNRVITLLLLCFGLRPSELLSMRVRDLKIGAISSIEIHRRPHDPEDPRKLSPEVKREGRILPIVSPTLVRILDGYIGEWRWQFEEKNLLGTDFLILSDEGEPLSYDALYDVFVKLRVIEPTLPGNFSPKTLRHTFTSDLEREMRQSGVDEDRRTKILMQLRGDTSEKSQDTYKRAAVKEDAQVHLKAHQESIFMMSDISGELPF